MPPSLTTEAKTLKPCPFCGGPAAIEQTGREELTLRCVGVQPSGLHGCGVKYIQKWKRFSKEWLADRMTENWNRRTVDPSLLSLIEDMAKALEAAKKRMLNCRGAIESNQVIDKDTRGSLTNGMADVDSALSRYTEFMEQNARALSAQEGSK